MTKIQINRPYLIGFYELFAILAGAIVLLLAYLNQLGFPLPCNDEARFYLPALWWAEHQSLQPANINAPQGIFWVPDGFTLFIGSALALFGHSIEVARYTCEVTVALGVCLFALAFRKLSDSWLIGCLSTLLLVTPPLIFAANMVRMEALIFTVLAICLLLHLHSYRVAAATLLFGSMLIHPILAPTAFAYFAINFALYFYAKKMPVIRTLDWFLFMVVGLAFIVELIHIFQHWDLFKQHMNYQLERKRGVAVYIRFLRPQGGIFLLCLLVVARFIYLDSLAKNLSINNHFLTVAIIGLSLIFTAVLGYEMSYNFFSVTVGPTIIFCIVAQKLALEQTSTSNIKHQRCDIRLI
ncbi:hypothetical protein [Methylomonas sp. AM2-LC]|uniref:hypothetical protein n=1 Tax=Methylomonas sp. AM2-LC TaxID=3153301 RepID=UPI00326438C4